MFQTYLTSAPNVGLGPLALIALALLAVSAVAGIGWSHRPANDALHDQVRARLGTAIATWSSAEIGLVMWRFAGMGDARLIAYLGILVWAAMVAYAGWYVAIRVPRNYKMFEQLRERFNEGNIPRAMRGGTRVEDRLSPGWAQAGAGIGAIVLYLSMFLSTDHALHWLMILVGALLGYSIGLVLTAGRGISALAWRQAHIQPKRMKRTGRTTA